MITTNVHNATGIRAALRTSDPETAWLQFNFVGTEYADLSVFLPRQLAPRRILLDQLRDDVAAAIEETQRAIVDENHRALEALDGNDPRLIDLTDKPTEADREAEADAINRSLERENAFFTRTHGWDPSRPDGP